ncbi:response regulator [Thiocapsa sp. UBA6158]|jgi:DNA-binding NarL/FixJ family response regulator|uniref:response regulator n=1 Tax=Thiocapsa sp. UBA6158 TaxID=1947692 RepID=UPI0025E8DE58|nr:response regulator [Thiocapsa sp. UBA6158]
MVSEPLSDLPSDLRLRFDLLTPRQREVCVLMAAGLMNKEIAERLGASINTIKSHRTEIFRKLGASSLVDLVRMVDRISAGGTETGVGSEPAAALSTPTGGSTGPLRLLVVEDEPLLRDVMVTMLTARGYAVTGLADGEGLDQALATAPVDVALLDILLGEDREDGYTLAARLRRCCRCGIIMTTALGELEERIRGLDQGADAYLMKPIDFDELEAVIHSISRRLR